MEVLLAVKDLHTYFYLETGVARAVEGVSFEIRKGETLALVGESGCGKTVTALSIMRLVPSPPGEIVQGEINFRGGNLRGLSEKQMRFIRGRHIGMVFQEPMTSLNPLYTIGYQIAEAVAAHRKIKRRELKKEVLGFLQRVEMPHPESRYHDYPHNLSGGLRQRAMIAQGLAGQPDLLIADEPTTALDVTIQAQILELFLHLKQSTRMSFLLITHNLGIVAEIADRVCIMYAGRIVEEADVFTIFHKARHPYTQGLLNSIPGRAGQARRLTAIAGTVPHPASKPEGCPFHPRCIQADQRCKEQLPALIEIESGHRVSCLKVR